MCWPILIQFDECHHAANDTIAGGYPQSRRVGIKQMSQILIKIINNSIAVSVIEMMSMDFIRGWRSRTRSALQHRGRMLLRLWQTMRTPGCGKSWSAGRKSGSEEVSWILRKKMQQPFSCCIFWIVRCFSAYGREKEAVSFIYPSGKHQNLNRQFSRLRIRRE